MPEILKNDFADRIRSRLNGKRLTFDEVCLADANQRIVNTRSSGRYDLFSPDDLNDIRKKISSPLEYCKKSINKAIPLEEKNNFYVNFTQEVIMTWFIFKNNINDCKGLIKGQECRLLKKHFNIKFSEYEKNDQNYFEALHFFQVQWFMAYISVMEIFSKIYGFTMYNLVEQLDKVKNSISSYENTALQLRVHFVDFNLEKFKPEDNTIKNVYKKLRAKKYNVSPIEILEYNIIQREIEAVRNRIELLLNKRNKNG